MVEAKVKSVKPAGGRRSRKREAILDAARTLFCTEGYPGTSMDAVAATAGVSKATLYAHFVSKQDLFFEVLSCFTNAVIRLPESLLDAPLEEGMKTIAHRFLELITSQEAVANFRFLAAHGTAFPEMVSTFESAGPCPVVAAVAAYFQHQDVCGRLVIPDAQMVAMIFLHAVKGDMHTRAVLDMGASPFKADAIVDEVVRIILAAYAPPDAR